MSKKILIIDDDPEILEIIQMLLTLEKYDVVTAENGMTGLSYAREQKFDLLILDLNLPDVGGQQICKIIRSETELPILILSARDDVNDKVICLEYGADDYLTKPFENIELTARVKAILRRTDTLSAQSDGDEPGLVNFHHLVIDKKNRQLLKDGEKIEITPKEYELLLYFAGNCGRVLDRDEIVKSIWGSNTLYKWSRSLDVHVKNLRQKIEVNPKNPAIIQTVTGTGYKVKK